MKRKNKADTYLVGFQGHAVCCSANSCSVQYQPPGMSEESLSVIWTAPNLEQIMARAAEIEAGNMELGTYDALVSNRNASMAWSMSRVQLEMAGFLP
jgi:hypothetical protein